MNEIYTEMEEAARKRAEKYTTFIVNEMPSLQSLDDHIVLGSYSWSGRSRRWIYSKYVANLYGVQTPGEIARDYIKAKYKKRLRAVTEQYHEIMRHRQQPLFAMPCSMVDGVYIDLKSAYWSILLTTGWDADYFSGKWLGIRSSVEDFPVPNNKLARNGLVSLGISKEVLTYFKGQLRLKKAPNPIVNYGLWALVQDVLNGVADDMFQAGACYIHTDGYILPASKLPIAEEILASWGLPWGIKHRGQTQIRGVGQYKIGEKESLTFEHSTGFYKSIMPVEKEWLKWNFLRLSERAPRMWLPRE
jgi:hypothetical protein